MKNHLRHDLMQRGIGKYVHDFFLNAMASDYYVNSFRTTHHFEKYLTRTCVSLLQFNHNLTYCNAPDYLFRSR